MNPSPAHPCTCVECPGAACTCGCRDHATPSVAAAPPACHCARGCGCEGGEQGCLCSRAG